MLVDGIDHHGLHFADPALLEADFVKLTWSAALLGLTRRDEAALASALDRLPPERTVLCRADTESALRWGLDRGIRCFQGRHVDAILAVERLATCAHAGQCALRQCIDRAAATDAAGQAGCADLDRLAGLHHRIAGALRPAAA